MENNQPQCIEMVENLEELKKKQDFRVSVGRSKWYYYDHYNPKFNLREVLDDEVVFELDCPFKWKEMTQEAQDSFREFSMKAINEIGIKLYKDGISFSIWEHGGKSPHLHVEDLPCVEIKDKKERKLWKEAFVKHYTPKEYLEFVDLSLCGIHLVALEFQFHWKGCYGVKKLMSEFNPKEKQK